MSQEPLRTFIFCILGASGRRFSSLSALRFLGFRLCCPSSVHASIFLSHTFCTYSLRVFPNTAGHQIVLRRLLREACSIRRSTSSATAPCKTTMSNSKVQSGWGFPHPYPPRGHASAAGRPRPLSPGSMEKASVRDLEKIIGPNLAPRRPQDRRQEGFFRILDPSWAIFVDLGPILAPTSHNIVQARRQDAPTIPNYDPQTIKNL